MTILIGTVLMFAADFNETVKNDLYKKGWLPCDGKAYSNADTNNPYYPLYSLIEYAYGGNQDEYFVPQYQGLFLRGVSGSSGRDPDAESRHAPRKDGENLGNMGNNVGSSQYDAFEAHQHEYKKFSSKKKMDVIIGNECVKPGSTVTKMVEIGGTETRPINQYVNYIIKYSDTINEIPVGAVVPFGGNKIKSLAQKNINWLPCDGSEVNQENYPNLFENIGNGFGGNPEVQMFCLPDFRGQFLRAVQGTDVSDAYNKTFLLDPEAEIRTAPRPEPEISDHGNTGNNVGSIQGYEIKLHSHDYDKQTGNRDTAKSALGTVICHASDEGYEEKLSTKQPKTIDEDENEDTTKPGEETRPINMYVNFLIKAAD